MVLYTIVSEYDIFRGLDESRRCCRQVDGIYLEGENSQDGLHIDRIISTDPKDYLHGRYQLGGYLK